MFKWLKHRLVEWAGFFQQREIETLLEENRRLKEERLRHGDGKPIRLSPEERQRLLEKRIGIDPEILKRIDPRDVEDLE